MSKLSSWVIGFSVLAMVLLIAAQAGNIHNLKAKLAKANSSLDYVSTALEEHIEKEYNRSVCGFEGMRSSIRDDRDQFCLDGVARRAHEEVALIARGE